MSSSTPAQKGVGPAGLRTLPSKPPTRKEKGGHEGGVAKVEDFKSCYESKV